MHAPKEYPGKLGSKIQEYLLFRTGSDIHLIMNQRIGSDLNLPEELAWVTPIPSVPSSYFQENDSLFKTLFHATQPVMRGLKSNNAPRGFNVHDTVKVGAYEIIPLEITDTLSGNEINQWLEKNGYAKVPLEGLRYYLKPKSCFLAIKVKGLRGKETMLHPLHVVYRAKEARLPLKFFANAGQFEVFVYVRKSTALRVEQEGLAKAGFQRTGQSPSDKESIRNAGITAFPSDTSWIERYHANEINSKENPLSKWKQDPLIALD